ncbi:MAG: proline--tRNA ligase, partial [Clostridia bacterium]|nr:proline--tRNA ligase [Clostridia bacterium]
NEIFNNMGLDFIVVDADSGAMGGSGSQEFMVKSEVGEDTIAFCECGFASNIEKAACVPEETACPEGDLAVEKIHTPNIKTIEDLTNALKIDEKMFVKTLIYNGDGKIVAVMLRGDRELNETKLQNYLGCTELTMADFATVEEVTGAKVGFAGPIGIKCPVLMDSEVALMKNYIVGANETDYHYVNVNKDRDFTPDDILDLRTIVDGDKCPKCGKPISTVQGIEVGHIFKLGTKYSEALGCGYLDENGKDQPMIMGCYGIGVNRCVAAVIEQHCDENGIVWPMSVAPFKVEIVPVNVSDEVQMNMANELYNTLTAKGIDVLMDDRDERAGVKFKDADLMGAPIRITVGKGAKDGLVEYKLRAGGDVLNMTPDEAITNVLELVK